MLESGLTRSLVAKLLQCWSLVVRELNAAGEVRNFDAAPEAYQNDRSYVHELRTYLYFRFTTQEFDMVGGYTENLKKKPPQNCQNWGVGTCTRGWALARDNTVSLCEYRATGFIFKIFMTK